MLPRSWLALAVTLGCAWPLPLRSCSSSAPQLVGPPRAAAPARFSLKLGRCAGLAGSASVAGLQDSEAGRGAGQSDSSRIGAILGGGSCGEAETRVVARVARLRGGGKGGCKAKHLSRVTEGRRKMVEKHSHRNLLLGSQYNGTIAAARVLDARSPNWVAQPTKKRIPDDDDDDSSASSWEIAEQVNRFKQAISSNNDPLPEKGLIPLTRLGAEHYGAPALAHSFAGRPLQILTRARDPRDGDLWGMGANYDGQLGLAEGSKMDRASATRQVFLKGGIWSHSECLEAEQKGHT